MLLSLELVFFLAYENSHKILETVIESDGHTYLCIESGTLPEIANRMIGSTPPQYSLRLKKNGRFGKAIFFPPPTLYTPKDVLSFIFIWISQSGPFI